MTRIVVGDVGGCADELRRVVVPLAEDPDAVVVQVGDLVDRGPDSTGVLALVAERLPAATAADLLNTRPEPLLWHERGPLWAEAGPHLYRSWLDAPEPPPFGQVHGHSTIVSYSRRAWACSELIRARSAVDWDARRTVTRVRGARFVAVDPKHGRTGAPAWSPFVPEGATLLAGSADAR